MNDRDTHNVFARKGEGRHPSAGPWLWMSFVLESTWLTLAAAQAML